MNDRTIQEIYGIPKDNSDFNSSLVKWYNKMINKKYLELDVVDVSKMIRQGILKNVAFQRAIELFITNPYDGEMYDGDLLNTIANYDEFVIRHEQKLKLLEVIEMIKNDFNNFEWNDDKTKKQFIENLLILGKKINSIK